MKIERLIYDTLPFREKFKMKSEDTLDWYPAQLPPVKIILGEAVLAVGKQGRPINTRTLLEYLQVIQDKQKRRDDKIAMQTAIDVLRIISALTADVNAPPGSVSVLNDLNRMVLSIILQRYSVIREENTIQRHAIFCIAA